MHFILDIGIRRLSITLTKMLCDVIKKAKSIYIYLYLSIYLSIYIYIYIKQIADMKHCELASCHFSLLNLTLLKKDSIHSTDNASNSY